MVKKDSVELESGGGARGLHPCRFDVKYHNKIQEK
jgi:hypothetical protein